MANPHRGGVPLQVGDREYTLSFSVNALCELEDCLDEPVAKIAVRLTDPQNVRVSAVRALVWAALRDHHPDIDLTGAGALATEAGIPVCVEAVGRAFQLAFPEADDAARPPKAKAGIRSTT